MTEQCVFIRKINDLNDPVPNNFGYKINKTTDNSNSELEKHIYHKTMQILTQYG